MIASPSLEELLAGLTSHSPDLCRQAAQDVGIHGCKELAPHLPGLLASNHAGVQQAAADAIIALNYCPTTEVLSTLLIHSDPTVRSATIGLLDRLGQRCADPVAELAVHENVDVRVAIAQLLGRIGHPRCSQLLVAMLGDSEVNVRVMVAESIASLRDYGTVPTLLEHLTDDPWVVCSVVSALGELGVADVAPAIDRALQNALDLNDMAMAQACVDTICRLGDPGYLKILLGRMLLAKPDQATIFRSAMGFSAAFLQLWPVLRGLESELIEATCTSGGVTVDDLAGLGKLGDYLSSAAADSLIAFAAATGADDPRRPALLAAIGRSCPTDLLLTTAASDDDALATVALAALAQRDWVNIGQAFQQIVRKASPARKLSILKTIQHMADPSTVGLVEKLLDDEDGHVRGAAAMAAGALGSATLLDKLQQRVISDYPDVATAAAIAITQIEGGKKLLLDTAHVLPPERKSYVLEGLRNQHGPDAMQIVADCLHDANHEVRVKAAEILLSESDDPELAQQLLSSEDPFLRRAAVRAIPKYTAQCIADLVNRLLQTWTDPWELYELVRMCQRCDLRQCEAAMISLLSATHMAVRIAALETLSHMGCMDAIQPIAMLTESEDADLAKAAATALDTITMGGLV